MAADGGRAFRPEQLRAAGDTDEGDPRSLDASDVDALEYPPLEHAGQSPADLAAQVRVMQMLDPERILAAGRRRICPVCFDPSCPYSDRRGGGVTARVLVERE